MKKSELRNIIKEEIKARREGLKESVNEANLGDELWPEGDEEPDGEAIKKLLKPFYKVMMTSRYSRMETGHFDEAIKDYILDFMPELIKNKRDLVRDFKDHLETMGLWKKPINENEPINEGEETFDDLKKKAKKVKGYKNHGKFGFSIPYSYGDIEIEPIDKKHSAFNKERIRITWSSSDNTDSQVSPLSVGYNIVNKELKESVNEAKEIELGGIKAERFEKSGIGGWKLTVQSALGRGTQVIMIPDSTGTELFKFLHKNT